jgi:hypothetical protein
MARKIKNETNQVFTNVSIAVLLVSNGALRPPAKRSEASRLEAIVGRLMLVWVH